MELQAVSENAVINAEKNPYAAGQISNPLTLYVVADAHVGRTGRGDRIMSFAEMCNAKNPDIILDLGDTIEAGATGFYDYDAPGEAAMKQQQHWLKAWNSIAPGKKAVALGNRDVFPGNRPDRHTLSEKQWVCALGYSDRPEKGGTKLQEAFIVENNEVKALVIVICAYAESYHRSKTLKWIEEEVRGFTGDFIVFAAHQQGPYMDILSILEAGKVNTPAIYLHGHNHGPDTLVRDAWGYEAEAKDFPMYLMTALMNNPVAAKFQLHRNGYHEKFRMDLKTRRISKPTLHFQTRVSDGG